MDALLTDVRAGRGTLGRLVTDDALYTELQAFVTSAHNVTRALNEGQGTIGGLLRDRKAYESLRSSLENLQTMTARINSGQGALGRLLNDEALGKSISGAATNAEQITARLTKGEGTAGKLLDEIRGDGRIVVMGLAPLTIAARAADRARIIFGGVTAVPAFNGESHRLQTP